MECEIVKLEITTNGVKEVRNYYNEKLVMKLKEEIKRLKEELNSKKNTKLTAEQIELKAKECKSLEEMKLLEKEISDPYYDLSMLFFISKHETKDEGFF